MGKTYSHVFAFGLSCLLSWLSPCCGTEFQELMGKNTDHWIYVSKQEDLQALDRFEKLYEKNKELCLLDKKTCKIPPIVHFIWLGPRPFPPESVENVRTWIAQHPDWQVIFWTDREREAPCASMQVRLVEEFPFLFLGKCFVDSQNFGEKSDILRFEILYQQGGIYVDHDANCLQKFDRLGQYDFYCGLEVPHPPFAGRNITSGNGVIGSRPFHPVIGKVIELIRQEWEDLGRKYRGRDGYSRTQLVMERTYMKLTLALLERVDEDGNLDIVFPAAYFFAKKGLKPLYSQHFFANAWASEENEKGDFEKQAKKSLHKLHRKNNLLYLLSNFILAINLFVFGGLFVYFWKQRRREKLK